MLGSCWDFVGRCLQHAKCWNLVRLYVGLCPDKFWISTGITLHVCRSVPQQMLAVGITTGLCWAVPQQMLDVGITLGYVGLCPDKLVCKTVKVSRFSSEFHEILSVQKAGLLDMHTHMAQDPLYNLQFLKI